MFRKLWFLGVLTIFVIALGGCATGRKQGDLEIQGLRNQINVLETQLQAKDNEINALKESLDKFQGEKFYAGRTRKSSAHKVVSGTKSQPTARQIQTALKNAGYYFGAIDGKIGRQTRRAIKEFQRANNLKASGKVEAQTWNLLRVYLEKRVK
jgi:peptidoglycan hydrolase-like protein with peptidoglycan-binding domain